MRTEIPIGARGQAEQQVKFEDTLKYFNPELPEVYSTPHMVGLMETAAYNAMKPYCQPGEISVGTAINIQHRASVGVGAVVKAEAELEAVQGKFFVFRVSARAVNGSGEYEIGRGTVSRAIIDMNKHMDKLKG